jgi:hypothetical protein
MKRLFIATLVVMVPAQSWAQRAEAQVRAQQSPPRITMPEPSDVPWQGTPAPTESVPVGRHVLNRPAMPTSTRGPMVTETHPHVAHRRPMAMPAPVNRMLADRYTAALNRAELESVASGSSTPPATSRELYPAR